MYGYGYPPAPGMRVDVNGDGIPDYRVGPYGQVRPDVGAYVPPAYPPAYGGMYGPPMGRGVDIDGDGISDIRVGPYGQVRPDIGMVVHGPPMYPPPYY